MWQLHTNLGVLLRTRNWENWLAFRMILSTWFDYLRAVITFWVTYSLVLHTCNKLVTLWWILSATDNFTCSIKWKSSILSSNRSRGTGFPIKKLTSQTLACLWKAVGLLMKNKAPAIYVILMKHILQLCNKACEY